MKALPTLVRLAKRELDVLQRELGELIGKRLDVDTRLAAHDQSIRHEQSLAARDYEGARAFSGYIGIAIAGRRRSEDEGKDIDTEIERLRGLIQEAHVEMRKFERLLEIQDERERVLQERREDAEMDERATLQAGRKPLV
jgi:flagellar export protein FliJ